MHPGARYRMGALRLTITNVRTIAIGDSVEQMFDVTLTWRSGNQLTTNMLKSTLEHELRTGRAEPEDP